MNRMNIKIESWIYNFKVAYKIDLEIYNLSL